MYLLIDLMTKLKDTCHKYSCLGPLTFNFKITFIYELLQKPEAQEGFPQATALSVSHLDSVMLCYYHQEAEQGKQQNQ